MKTSYDFGRPLRIGTRRSPLALWQANRVSDVLLAAGLIPGTEIVEIQTTGDKVQNRLLSEIGGKGLFSKEIEENLAAGKIDIAVHSMKDVETELAPGFVIAAILERADARDAWISISGMGLDTLPAGARVGTASLRRKAQVLARRPDLTVVTFRGNVGTRLNKLAAGEADATLLAKAGLDRLEMADCITEVLAPGIMLPAAAQGAVGIEARIDDGVLLDALVQINHTDTSLTVNAERALLAALDGSCRTPIGAYAILDNTGCITLQALLASEDGAKTWRTERHGAIADADRMSADAGAELRAAGDAHLFED